MSIILLSYSYKLVKMLDYGGLKWQYIAIIAIFLVFFCER